MLPKKNRAVTKDVEKVFKDGIFLNSSNLSFRYIKKGNSVPRISFLAPKSVAKTAVRRNFLRRLGYKLLKEHFPLSPVGVVGVFVFKKYQEDALILTNEIKNILSKIN